MDSLRVVHSFFALEGIIISVGLNAVEGGVSATRVGGWVGLGET